MASDAARAALAAEALVSDDEIPSACFCYGCPACDLSRARFAHDLCGRTALPGRSAWFRRPWLARWFGARIARWLRGPPPRCAECFAVERGFGFDDVEPSPPVCSACPRGHTEIAIDGCTRRDCPATACEHGFPRVSCPLCPP